MLINPKKSSLNLPLLKSNAANAVSHEKYRKEVPGLNDKFSEEFFVPFSVQSNSTPIMLCTYREHGKNLQNIEKPRALLFLAHGLFAHENRCAHIAKFFSNLGVTTVGYDARGHGKSGGLPGYVDNFDISVTDCEAFMDLMDKIYSEDIPRFFIGQSMGGMLGFMVGLKKPNYFKGMMFFAPSLKQNSGKKFLMNTAKFLSYIISTYPIKLPRKNDSSKNPAVFENIMVEPFIYKGGIRMGTIKSLVNAMNFSSVNIEKFKVAFVMVQGGCDNLVDVECNIDLFERSPTTDKTLVFYENLWHDVAHEEEIFEILDFLGKWLEIRIKDLPKESMSIKK